MTCFAIGSDAPEVDILVVADLMENVDFKVFSGPAKDTGGRVAALR